MIPSIDDLKGLETMDVHLFQWFPSNSSFSSNYIAISLLITAEMLFYTAKTFPINVDKTAPVCLICNVSSRLCITLHELQRML